MLHRIEPSITGCHTLKSSDHQNSMITSGVMKGLVVQGRLASSLKHPSLLAQRWPKIASSPSFCNPHLAPLLAQQAMPPTNFLDAAMEEMRAAMGEHTVPSPSHSDDDNDMGHSSHGSCSNGDKFVCREIVDWLHSFNTSIDPSKPMLKQQALESGYLGKNILHMLADAIQLHSAYWAKVQKAEHSMKAGMEAAAENPPHPIPFAEILLLDGIEGLVNDMCTVVGGVKKTPLMIVVKQRKSTDELQFMACQYAEWLVREGADPDVDDGAPLRLAIASGNTDLVKMLLQFASLDAANAHFKKMATSRHRDVFDLAWHSSAAVYSLLTEHCTGKPKFIEPQRVMDSAASSSHHDPDPWAYFDCPVPKADEVPPTPLLAVPMSSSPAMLAQPPSARPAVAKPSLPPAPPLGAPPPDVVASWLAKAAPCPKAKAPPEETVPRPRFTPELMEQQRQHVMPPVPVLQPACTQLWAPMWDSAWKAWVIAPPNHLRAPGHRWAYNAPSNVYVYFEWR